MVGRTLVLFDGPVQGCQDLGQGRGTLFVQAFDRNQVDLLGHTKGAGTDDASNKGAMSIIVSVGSPGNSCGTPSCTALKVDMVDINASVDHVDINTLTCSIGIVVIGAKR